METIVPPTRRDRRLVLIGLGCALAGPLFSGLGTAAALVVAAVLAQRGQSRAAALLAAVALLALAVTYVLIQGLFMPVNTGPVPLSG